jgi:membrane-associated phospholipid phosphatase
LRRPRKSARRPNPALSNVVRAVAGAAVVAAVALPPLRRRIGLKPSASVAVSAAGPPALAVFFHRTRLRDASMFALQMWGFITAHEIPYDDPEALERRLKVKYPIVADRIIGGGTLPNTRLQRAFSRPGRVTVLDRFLSFAHWAWFFEPHLALIYLLLRDEERFARAARQMAATYDLGCAAYFAVPTAPPWWAAANGYAPEGVRRVMLEVGEEVFRENWKLVYETVDGNPWAAMPSLHFGSSLMAGLLLRESSRTAGAIGLSYSFTLGFALVYLGEHYVSDLIAGAALVFAVRNGEPLAAPVVNAVSRGVQRLEQIANG